MLTTLLFKRPERMAAETGYGNHTVIPLARVPDPQVQFSYSILWFSSDGANSVVMPWKLASMERYEGRDICSSDVLGSGISSTALAEGSVSGTLWKMIIPDLVPLWMSCASDVISGGLDPKWSARKADRRSRPQPEGTPRTRNTIPSFLEFVPAGALGFILFEGVANRARLQGKWGYDGL